MKRTLQRVATIGLASSVVAALAIGGATSAAAAPDQYAPSIGTAVGTSLTGPTNIPVSIRTSAPCPTGTTSVNGFINSSAAGIVDGVAISANSTDIATLPTSGMPLNNNLLGIAQDAGRVLVNGRYELSVVCYPDPFSEPTAQFDAVFNVTGAPSATTPGTTYTYEVAAAPASTTVLAASPAGSANLGANVTLTATVTSTAAVAGTVTFKDGAVTVGTAPVTGGTATFSTTSLAAGTRSLTAEFVPADAGVVSGSTSAPVSYTIVAPAQATTTTLSSSPAAPTTADVVALTATVAPVGAAGTVTFKEGATTVGTAAVSGTGTASISLTGLSAGPHTYTGEFVPTNPAQYLGSTSAAATITVTTFAGAVASENITATIPAGALTITAGGTVDLGTLALNSTNTRFETAAPKDINTVTVTDTRAGSLGWTVNGVASNFVGGTGSDQINSANLGWVPRVVSTGTGQTVTAGPAQAPAGAVAPADPSTAGLKAAKLLASSPVGTSVGTAEITAALSLLAPTTTRPGVYNSTLTLTAL